MTRVVESFFLADNKFLPNLHCQYYMAVDDLATQGNNVLTVIVLILFAQTNVGSPDNCQ